MYEFYYLFIIYASLKLHFITRFNSFFSQKYAIYTCLYLKSYTRIVIQYLLASCLENNVENTKHNNAKNKKK